MSSKQTTLNKKTENSSDYTIQMLEETFCDYNNNKNNLNIEIPFETESINSNVSTKSSNKIDPTTANILKRKIEKLESENIILYDLIQTKSNENDLLKVDEINLLKEINDLELKLKEHESMNTQGKIRIYLNKMNNKLLLFL
jgi:hypothetical protein